MYTAPIIQKEEEACSGLLTGYLGANDRMSV